ncbi:hypothetical protein GIB67_030349 [Kingdonia uniflora]|uniref:Dof zinc finger protein n=1 Tax=Kingdonia uniflora TaxID=39325 RepID=A0A7J7M716_9MAGN|nr:hypothetical protein GIB67_030349 [Kingdonia uniflora]
MERSKYSNAIKLDVEKFDGNINFGLWQIHVQDILIQGGLRKALKGKPIPKTSVEGKNSVMVVSGKKSFNRFRKGTCWSCGQSGHYRSDCKAGKSNRASSARGSENDINKLATVTSNGGDEALLVVATDGSRRDRRWQIFISEVPGIIDTLANINKRNEEWGELLAMIRGEETSGVPHEVMKYWAMATHSIEDTMGTCQKAQQEMKKTLSLKPPQEQSLKCPRCDSSNTKFCYYNNYSLTQPRYFCKGCRRYWTKGGSLRNVPVGGGCRKSTKRSSSSSSSTSSSSRSRISSSHHQDQVCMITNNNSNPLLNSMIPSLTYDSNDLSLTFGGLHKQTTRLLGFDDHDTSILGHLNSTHYGNPNVHTSTTSSNPGFLDALRSGFLDTQSGGFNNFYYGFGNGVNMGEVDNGASVDGGGEDQIVLPYEDLSGATTTKQDFSINGEENRVFLNFPWQFGGDHHQANNNNNNNNNNMGVSGGGASDSSGRDCWINGIGSSWHGLVNSPLM